MVGGIIGLSLIAYATYEMLKQNDNTNDICKSKELKSLMGDGIKISSNVRLSVKQSNTHILMVAPSESGKSRRFVMQNVNSLSNCSMVVTDPSGEIASTCKPTQKKYILNPFSEETIGYDPLSNCKDEFEVRKIANVILLNGMNATSDKNKTNQKDWVGMATPLLKAYMLMNYYTKKYTFDELIRRICTMPLMPEQVKDKNGKDVVIQSIFNEIVTSGVESAITEILAFKQVIAARETLSSIRTVMNTCLQVFLDKNLKKVFRKPNLDLSQIRKEESIVYIQIPEHHSEYFSPLIATFLTQMFDKYLENDGLQMYFIFDEFANIGIIPNICKLLSTARKHCMSIIAAIQSINQLNTLYGEAQAKELVELFKTLVVCGGLKDSAEYVSNLLGTRVEFRKESRYTTPLMTPDEIRRLSKDDVLIVCNNKRPVIDRMMDIVA